MRCEGKQASRGGSPRRATSPLRTTLQPPAGSETRVDRIDVVPASEVPSAHPACYAYVGTLAALPFAFVYLWTASTVMSLGAAALLNGFVLAVGLIVGEGNWAFVTGMVVLTLLTEAMRARCGYDTWRGVYLSFVPFAYSFYAYSAHWWTDTAGSLAAAVEEMPAGYADKMAPVIANTPMLVLMLLLVVPVAVLSMRLADVVLAGQTGHLR